MEPVDELPRKMNPLLVWGIGLAVVVVLGFLGYHFLYSKWMPERLSRQAAALVTEGEFTIAGLKARRALQMNPESVSAHRVMAEINEAIGSPHVVVWRQRVVDLDPRSIEDRLYLIQASLRSNEKKIARHALEGFEEDQKDSAAYHAAAGAIAEADGNHEKVVEEYGKAVKRAPENRSYVFDLARAKLRSDDYSVRREGVQTLESLSEVPEFRLRSIRAIIDDLASRKLFTEAARRATELAKDPNASFPDRIRSVEMLYRTSNLAYVGELIKLEREATGDANKAGHLLTWLAFAGLEKNALQLGKELPEDFQDRPFVNAPLALAYVRLGDFDAAENLAKESQWGKFEFLRRAILAKAMRDSGNEPGFRAEWNLAVAAAQKEATSLIQLSQLTHFWGWHRELRELLWPIARSPDREAADWALKSLYKEYLDSGNTAGLLEVVDRMLELSPNDKALLNNRTMFSLLLNRRLEQAFETARRLYNESPEDPIVASTYAFAHFTEGRVDQAIVVMERLRAEDLQMPSVAGYYGLFLASGLRSTDAEGLLEIAKKAPLLPEEKALFEKARASN